MKIYTELWNKELNIVNHLIKYKEVYLLLLALLVLGIPTVNNVYHDEPLFIGGESYYHLSLADEISSKNVHYYPLHLAGSYLSENLLVFLPLVLGLISLLLFFGFARRASLPSDFTFFFLLFAILTPAFIFTFITLSGYSYLTMLALLSMLLLTAKHRTANILGIISLIVASLIEVFGSITMLILLFFITYSAKKKEKKILWTAIGIGSATTLLGAVLLKVPLFLGPFFPQKIIADFIVDLGGISGISLFVVLLSLVGLAVTWKKKRFYAAYLLLPIVLPAYFYTTQVIYIIGLLTIFFATAGMLHLLEWKWNFSSLKRFTVLLLILGIGFSSLTFIDRVQQYPPQQEETQVLLWMKNNVPVESVVFSAPENSYYIKYFAELTPFYSLDETERNKAIDSRSIYQAVYIHELFPVLERNSISHIYITKAMKNEFPEDRGLLILLKNERFKLVHSVGDTEVWKFT